MADSISYDYEFVFDDDFDQAVFDMYPIPDTDNTLQQIVVNVVSALKTIQGIYPGIRCITSYAQHDTQTLKITILNTSWVPPDQDRS
jgi:hypothetical protein